MNSRVEPEVICGPLSETGQQHGAVRGVDGRVDQPVLAGADHVQQPFRVERVGEHELDLGGGFLRGHDGGQPLARDQVLDGGDRGSGRREVRRVVDPDLVGPVLDPVRERPARRPASPRRRA